jgi:hypothetical protein
MQPRRPKGIEDFDSWNAGNFMGGAEPLRPRQVRYQAALRPDIFYSFDFKILPQIAQ